MLKQGHSFSMMMLKKGKLIRLILISAFALDFSVANAQFNDSINIIPSLPANLLPLKKISVNGYYRFFGINRDLNEPFVVIPGNAYASAPPFVLGVGDVYRDPPLLLLNISAQPTSKTYIGMDYALYHNFTGNIGYNPANLNLGINLTGSIQTDLGKYTVHMGGINWTDMSGMLFSSFVGYQRYSIYERYPWENNSVSFDRASNYFENGNISRDMRFGMQAFKGMMIDGNQLPNDFSFRFLYGVTPNQAVIGSQIPAYTMGLRIRKQMKNQVLGVNLMNYTSFLDSIAAEEAGIQLQTISYDLTYKGFELSTEFGRGQLYSRIQQEGWGEAFRLKIKTPAKITKVPFDLEGFYISPNFVNYYGNFLSSNTAFLSSASVNQDGSSSGASGGISNFAGSITDVGQISNNRKGFSFNFWIDVTKTTKINIGNMVSQEIKSMSRGLSFGHKINTLPFSRFVPFVNNVGVYSNWTSYFRGFSQSTAIIDTNILGLPKTLTNFNMLQAQLKQKVNLSWLPFYLLYVGSFGSAQPSFSLIPETTNKAYLRTTYHEFDAIFMIKREVSFITTLGKEYIVGNSQLSKGDDVNGILGSVVNSAINQESSLLGLGLDLAIAKNTNLYIRKRWFSQIDKSFVKDNIKGTETTIELKLYF
jgi:hypothetical protein